MSDLKYLIKEAIPHPAQARTHADGRGQFVTYPGITPSATNPSKEAKVLAGSAIIAWPDSLTDSYVSGDASPALAR